MYNPKVFWEKRLSKNFSLKGVGCAGFSYNYNKWVSKAAKESLNKILNGSLKGKKILDIGCGTGYYIGYYLSKGATDISGLDITEESITNLKKKYPHLKFFNADISQKIPSNRKYDIITAIAVLYHVVDNDKFENSIRNIRKLAKKGSLIIIQDGFLKKHQPPKAGTHCYFRDYESYKKILKKNGIEIIKKVPTFYFLNTPFDISNSMMRRAALSLWNITMSIFAKNEIIGNILGFVLYYLDRIMLKMVNDSISLETIACRVVK